MSTSLEKRKMNHATPDYYLGERRNSANITNGDRSNSKAEENPQSNSPKVTK
jgi:hypothetical protein